MVDRAKKEPRYAELEEAWSAQIEYINYLLCFRGRTVFSLIDFRKTFQNGGQNDDENQRLHVEFAWSKRRGDTARRVS